MNRLQGFLLNRIAAAALRNAGEGKYGPTAQKVYLNLDGVKTKITLAIGAATAAVIMLDQTGLCAYAAVYWSWFQCGDFLDKLAYAGGALTTACAWISGLDAGLKLDPPDLPVAVPRRE